MTTSARPFPLQVTLWGKTAGRMQKKHKAAAKPVKKGQQKGGPRPAAAHKPGIEQMQGQAGNQAAARQAEKPTAILARRLEVLDNQLQSEVLSDEGRKQAGAEREQVQQQLDQAAEAEEEARLEAAINNSPAWDWEPGGRGTPEGYAEIEANASPGDFYRSDLYQQWYFYGWAGIRKRPHPGEDLKTLAFELIKDPAARSQFLASVNLGGDEKAAPLAAPRSLKGPLDISALSEQEKRQEIDAIRAWREKEQDNEVNNRLTETLVQLLEDLEKHRTLNEASAAARPAGLDPALEDYRANELARRAQYEAPYGQYGGVDINWMVKGRRLEEGRMGTALFRRYLYQGKEVSEAEAQKILDQHQRKETQYLDHSIGEANSFVVMPEAWLLEGDEELVVENWWVIRADPDKAERIARAMVSTSNTRGMAPYEDEGGMEAYGQHQAGSMSGFKPGRIAGVRSGWKPMDDAAPHLVGGGKVKLKGAPPAKRAETGKEPEAGPQLAGSKTPAKTAAHGGEPGGPAAVRTVPGAEAHTGGTEPGSTPKAAKPEAEVKGSASGAQAKAQVEAPVQKGEPAQAPGAKPARKKPQKQPGKNRAAYKRGQDEMRRQGQADDQTERSDQRATSPKRQKPREKAKEERSNAPASIRGKAEAEQQDLYERARRGEFTHLSEKNKRRLLNRYIKLLRDSGKTLQQRNVLQGNFDEFLRTPAAVQKSGRAQQSYLAGGLRLKGQTRKGSARPDYPDIDTSVQGKVTRNQANLKSDRLRDMPRSEAVARAGKYTDQAITNERALPQGEKIIVRYIETPRDEKIMEAMVQEHFRAGSPIVEVHFGTRVFHNPHL